MNLRDLPRIWPANVAGVAVERPGYGVSPVSGLGVGRDVDNLELCDVGAVGDDAEVIYRSLLSSSRATMLTLGSSSFARLFSESVKKVMIGDRSLLSA